MDLTTLFSRMEEDFRAGFPADPEPAAHYFQPEEDMETELKWWDPYTGLRDAVDRYEKEGIYVEEI